MRTAIKAILLGFAMAGCTHTKKSTDTSSQQTQQGSNTKIEYRTNTIYTDTGSTTIYYRDSLIFSRDTVIQPIDKIINHWYRQQLIHDTFTQIKHDTTTITIKETVVQKEKEKLSFWFWVFIAVAVVLLLLRNTLLKNIKL